MMAEKGVVYRAELSASELGHLLESENLAEATVLLLRLTDTYFDIGLPTGFQPDDWPQGRVFTADLEVRWWKGVNGFLVEALSERKLPEGLARYFGTREEYEVRPTQLLLAGTYYPLADDPQGGFFAEAQIPQPLRHPYRGGDLKRGDRVHLRGWLYMRDGIACRIRFGEVVRYGE